MVSKKWVFLKNIYIQDPFFFKIETNYKNTFIFKHFLKKKYYDDMSMDFRRIFIPNNNVFFSFNFLSCSFYHEFDVKSKIKYL